MDFKFEELCENATQKPKARNSNGPRRRFLDEKNHGQKIWQTFNLRFIIFIFKLLNTMSRKLSLFLFTTFAYTVQWKNSKIC